MSDDPTSFNDLYGEPSSSGSAAVTTEDGNSNPVKMRIIGGLGLVALALAFYTFTGGFRKSTGETTENSQRQSESNENQQTKSGNTVSDKIKEVTGVNVADLANIDWASEEEKAVNKAAVLALLDKIHALESANLRLQELGAGIKSRLEGMKTSETGSKIAADKVTVAQYVAISEEAKNTVKEDVEATVFLSEINSLVKKWEAAGDWKYQPQPFVLKRLDTLLEKAETRRKALVVLNDGIEGLVAATNDAKPIGLLASAIAARATEGQQNLAERLSKIAEESRAAVIEKMENKVRDSETALAESLVKLEDAAILARAHENNQKVASVLQAIEDDKRAMVSAEQQRKLEQLYNADKAEIETYLLPFISDGRLHRGGAGGTGPMSYSVILSSGGLDDSIRGLNRLGVLANSSDRTKGGFPNGGAISWLGSPDAKGTENFLARAQTLLKKHGEYMSLKGILAK